LAGVQFPNDSATQRAVVSMGNLWRFSRFVDKCRYEDSVSIGFMGASVTAGSLASDRAKRYTSLLCATFEHAYEGLCIVEVNAGVGATNSRFGCSRVGADLLQHHPDMVVIDFTVNDYGTDGFITGPYEGLVRQCLSHDPEMPVVLLFMSNSLGELRDQQLHESVGEHYALPMVSYRDALWPLVTRGQLPWDSIAADHVHLNDNGHLLCASLLWEAFRLASDVHADQPAGLPAPRYTDMYDRAGVHTTDDTLVQIHARGWLPTDGQLAGATYKSLSPGDTLVLRADCRELTVGFHCALAYNALARVVVAGTLDTTLNNHLADDWGPGYTHFLQLFADAGPGPHQATVVNVSGGVFVVGPVLYAAR
jgi:lysophospholipase L1-like esterase